MAQLIDGKLISTQIKDESKTPEELIVFNEMSNAIKEAMKKLAASRVVGLIIAGEVIKDLTAKTL